MKKTFKHPYFRAWIKIYWGPSDFYSTPKKSSFGWLDKNGLTKYTGLTEPKGGIKK